MLKELTPRRACWIIAAIAFVTIAGAWVFEAAGYPPCDLCLKQRWAYYSAIPVAAALALLPPSGLTRAGLYLLALLWLASMVFGVYHSGVEWKWWQGPSTCGAGGGLIDGLPDLTAPVVLCTEAAIRIFGLSLAGWNAVISLALAAIAAAGARAQGSSSVSQ